MFHALIFSISHFNPGRPAGSHRIASHLRSQGWDVEVVDFTDFWTIEQLKQFVDSRLCNDTKFVGFSYVFNRGGDHSKVNQLCEYIRSKKPEVHFISGGQVEPLYLTHTDYHINGYAEPALDVLLKWLYSNGERPKFSINSFNEVKNKVKVIDANAWPAYQAWPWKKPFIYYEKRDFIAPEEFGQTELSRGCRFRCKFCSLPALGLRGDYTRDADDFREHLMRAYDDWGIKNWILSDETVNDSVEKLTKFADVVESLPWDPYMIGMVRADLMVNSLEQKEQMLRMGLLGHFYGIESFNHAAAKSVGKGMHPDKMKAGLLDAKQFFKSHVGKKFRSSAYFISGLQHETKESLEETMRWLKANWSDQEFGASELEIQNVETSKIYKVSDLSLDYANNGYTNMTDEEFQAALKREGVDSSIIDTERDLHAGMLWKNEHMDIVYASKWARKLYNSFTLGGKNMKKVQSRYLQLNFTKEDGTLMNIDERLGILEYQRWGYLDNFKNLFVTDYINKKLNYD